MRPPALATLLVAALLAGCGGTGARSYSRSQARGIVSGCVHKAGAKSVMRSGGTETASFGSAGTLEWGYVMSGEKVADVFFTEVSPVAAATRTKLNACLEPYGWKLGS